MTILTDQELNNYVSRIKLSQEKKSSYSNQIENLKNIVNKAINESKSTRVVKAIRAGSWKKGTALAPKGDYPLDIDMVFFMNIENGNTFDAEKLRNEVIAFLCQAYPNKNASDFSNGKKTIGVTFRGSGLEVDIVPFIPEYPNAQYGYQPNKKLDTGNFKTSVDKQLKYISEIKSQNSNFAPTVRMLKSWRNYQEIELPSFSIELVVAYLIDRGRTRSKIVPDARIPGSINSLILFFFERLGSESDLQISFRSFNSRSYPSPWIADPSNDDNNTLSQVSQAEWKEIVAAAENAYDTISYAVTTQDSGKTIELWKEIFGPSFSIRKT